MICRNFKIILFFLIFISQSLNAQIPAIAVKKFAENPLGYYFLTSFFKGKYTAMILDNNGSIVYYKNFKKKISSENFTIQSNGKMSFSSGHSFYLLDSLFNVIDTISCIKPIRTDKHEFQILKNGNFLILGFENVKVDVSKTYFKHKKLKDTLSFKSSVIQEIDKQDNIIFEWHAINHYNLEDMDTFYLGNSKKIVDWVHANSVEEDVDGNLLFSARNFNEITKISRKDGSILWRFGGKRNQFKIENFEVPFYGQHDIRRLKNGNISLFDGGNNFVFHGARALEFKLDETNLNAKLVWSYTYDTTLVSIARGNLQRFEDGGSLINFGGLMGARKDLCFVELDKENNKLFELRFLEKTNSYRVYKHKNLPWKLNKPKIECFDSLGTVYLRTTENHATYQWNNLVSSREIPVKKKGTYYVFVPYGNEAYISSEKIEMNELSCPKTKTN